MSSCSFLRLRKVNLQISKQRNKSGHKRTVRSVETRRWKAFVLPTAAERCGCELRRYCLISYRTVSKSFEEHRLHGYRRDT